jgi:hypothetical protein
MSFAPEAHSKSWAVIGVPDDSSDFGSSPFFQWSRAVFRASRASGASTAPARLEPEQPESTRTASTPTPALIALRRPDRLRSPTFHAWFMVDLILAESFRNRPS